MAPQLAILGLGISGMAAIRLALAKGHTITAINRGNVTEWPRRAELLGLDQKLLTLKSEEEITEKLLKGCEKLVVSPGVPPENPVLKLALSLNIPVQSELEFAASYLVNEKVIAITGTNGKTTTCTQLSRLLEIAGIKHFLGGNIGTPLSEYIQRNDRCEWMVLELSSFQTERLSFFAPEIAAILNITEHHLDRYQSFKDYAKAKIKLFQFQKKRDWAIYDESIPYQEDIDTQAQQLIMSPKYVELVKNTFQSCVPRTLFHHEWVNLTFVYHMAQKIPLSDLDKNFKNLLSQYQAVPFRLTPVACSGTKLSFFNDAKSTNKESLKKAVMSVQQTGESVFIVGGKMPEHFEFDQWEFFYHPHIVKVLAIGEVAVKMQKACPEKVVVCEDLQAVFLFLEKWRDRSVQVVFSPGHQSFDQYQNYIERGKHFDQLVSEFAQKS